MTGHVSVKPMPASMMLPQAVLHAWVCQREAHICINDVAMLLLTLLATQGCWYNARDSTQTHAKTRPTAMLQQVAISSASLIISIQPINLELDTACNRCTE